MLTTQEVFTKVSHHLLRQGAKALDITDRCVYRAINGRRCAAGCLIDDAHYCAGLENISVPDFDDQANPVGKALLASGVNPDHFAMIHTLQRCHDLVPEQHWEEKLRDLALSWSLEFSFPTVSV